MEQTATINVNVGGVTHTVEGAICPVCSCKVYPAKDMPLHRRRHFEIVNGITLECTKCKKPYTLRSPLIIKTCPTCRSH
jgi:hypothetical protein